MLAELCRRKKGTRRKRIAAAWIFRLQRQRRHIGAICLPAKDKRARWKDRARARWKDRARARWKDRARKCGRNGKSPTVSKYPSGGKCGENCGGRLSGRGRGWRRLISRF